MGVIGGPVLFGLLAGLYRMPPYSEPMVANQAMYIEPIRWFGNVGMLPLFNTNLKKVDIEVVLLEEAEIIPSAG